MDFVVDASVAMGWLLRSQTSRLTIAAEEALMDGAGWVPDHFGVEITRSLRNHERRGLLVSSALDEALTHLGRLSLKADPERMLNRLTDIVGLARRYRLRVADAAYLDLALRLSIPLATRDETLAQAADHARVRLLTA